MYAKRIEKKTKKVLIMMKKTIVKKNKIK